MSNVYIETYGCQMNVNDSEVVLSIMQEAGFTHTQEITQADVILVNTCAIRENAEQRIWGRLEQFRAIKKKRPYIKIGVLGCMAARLKEQLLEKENTVDIIVGPDGYRSLPQLLSQTEEGNKAINVLLSREETYADIAPVRYDSNGVSAFVSIIRGCNNACAYCVVPYTRGGERSRDPQSITAEIETLLNYGYKEITLLGQNVDSYCWSQGGQNIDFADLLEIAAKITSNLRVRFATSHPKDMTTKVIETMAKYSNICKAIHLPAQSGNERILKLMRRGYTPKEYLTQIGMIKSIIPNIGLSSDFIAGFCSESIEEHEDTLRLMEAVKFDTAFNFAYSERPNTKAARNYKDDVPQDEKLRRLNEIITLQTKHSLLSNQADVGKVFEVLVEGVSKKSNAEMFGRNSQNKVIVFPANNVEKGDYLQVKVTGCTSATLKGEIILS